MNIENYLKSSGNKDEGMRNILHKTKEILKGRGKSIIIHERSQDKECVTDVRKSFIYLAEEATCETDVGKPQVHVKKSFDSLSRTERFAFRVKGFFFVNRNRRLSKINYSHTLKINLRWKSNVTSPKKSMTVA